MNPTTLNPNTGRQFIEGEQYWLRQSDGMVIPRSTSRYEAPEGFIPVRAIDTEQLVADSSQLEAVPANFDPTNPNHTGAAVSFAGNHRVEEHDPSQGRPEPTTLSNVLDDHVTKAQSLANLALAAANGLTPHTDAHEQASESEAESQPKTRRARVNA